MSKNKQDIKDFIDKCEKNGIKLFCNDRQNISYISDFGNLNKDVINFIKKNKEEVINYLTNKIIDNKNAYGSSNNQFPLTDIQSAYYSGQNANYYLGGTSCYTYIEIKTKFLDTIKLEKAWHKTIEKHDMLRAIITNNGMQKVQSKVNMPKLEVIEIETFKEIEKSKEFIQNRDYYSNYNFKIGQWPMHKIVVSKNDKESVIHICIDMIIADYISINIFISDLYKYYENYDAEYNGDKGLFKKFVIDKTNTSVNILKSSEKYWINKIQNSIFESPKLKFPIKNTDNKAEFSRIEYMFGTKESKILKDISAKMGITTSNCILTAYYKTISNYSYNKNFAINITTMERPNGYENVIGDFTSVIVLNIKNESYDFISLARNIQSQLLENLSNVNYSGVKVIRELNRDREDKLIFPFVYTSTLGQENDLNNLFYQTSNWEIISGVSRTPQVIIDCQILENAGKIKIHWDYRKGIYETNEIKNMFSYLISQLSLLIDDKNYWTKKVINEDTVPRLNDKEIDMDMDLKEIKNQFYSFNFFKKIQIGSEQNMLFYGDIGYTFSQIKDKVLSISSSLVEDSYKSRNVLFLTDDIVLILAAIIGNILFDYNAIFVDYYKPKSRLEKIIKLGNIDTIIASKEMNKIIKDFEDIKILYIEDLYNNNQVTLRKKFNDQICSIYTSDECGYPIKRKLTVYECIEKYGSFTKKFNISDGKSALIIPEIPRGFGIYEILFSLFNEKLIVIPDQSRGSNPLYWMELIRANNVDTVYLNSNGFNYIVDVFEEDYTLENIEHIFVYGEFNFENREMFSIKKCIHLNGELDYGLLSSFFNYNDYKYKKDGYFGKQLVNNTIIVLDDKKNKLSNEEVGKIYVRNYDSNDVISETNEIYYDNFKYKASGLNGYITDSGEVYITSTINKYYDFEEGRFNLNEIEKLINSYKSVDNCFVKIIDDDKKEISAEIVLSNSPLCSIRDIDKIEKNCNGYFDEINEDKFLELWSELNNASLSDMLNMFLEAGLFNNNKKTYTKGEIHDYIKEIDEFYNTVDKMIEILSSEGVLENLETRAYRIIESNASKYKNGNRTKLWNKVFELGKELNYSEELLSYQRLSGEMLLDQLRGKIKGQELFFPKASTLIAENAYKDNIINFRLNKCASEIIGQINQKFINILELGAGVGGTTDSILSSLGKENIDYKYTYSDISNYFLNIGKEKFKNYNSIDYKIIDINKDVKKQVKGDDKFDVIISANVLHNSKNIEENLFKISRILKDGGLFLIIEATKESYSLITSLELKGGLYDFTDHRKNTTEVFTSFNKWLKLFKNTGYSYLFSVPSQNKKISECGQTLFVCQKAIKDNEFDVGDLEEFLKERIPTFAIPTEYTVKEDIQGNELVSIDSIYEYDQMNIKEKLDKDIYDVWSKILGNKNIKIYDNFYQLGGDSLLLAQVVSEMKNNIETLSDIEWDDLMNFALNNSTIDKLSNAISNQLSTIVKSKTTENNIDCNCIVRFKNPVNKNKTTYALFHSGTGRLIDYEILIPELKKAVDKNDSIIGFTYGDQSNYLETDTDRLIEERAENYAKYLMNIESSDYCLVGYCVGGYFALETAIKLRKHGVNVSKVVMISSELCNHKISNELILEIAYGQAIGLDMKKAGYNIENGKLCSDLRDILNGENRDVNNSELISNKCKYHNLFMSLIDFSHDERLKNIFTKSENRKFNGEDSSFAMFKILYNIFKKTFVAMMKYDLKNKYEGVVYDLRAPVHGNMFPTMVAKKSLSDFVKELKEIQLKGNHGDCLLNLDNINKIIELLISKN